MKWPCAATGEPNTATPMTLPVWRVVFSVPGATPDRDRSTLPARQPRPGRVKTRLVPPGTPGQGSGDAREQA